MRRRAGWLGVLLPAILMAMEGSVFGQPPVGADASTASSPPPLLDALSDPTTLPATLEFGVPHLLALPPDAPPPDSVYAPPEPPRDDQGENKGGVTTEAYFRYMTDDVYRGVSHDRASGGNIHAANYQAQTQLSFDLGRLPHPYVGVLVDVNDSDPVSRFQEIRPTVGVEETVRPLIFNLGYNAYIYPERERLNPSPNTSEVFLKLTLDDSFFSLTPKPIFSPYIYGAYDYQLNKGWYLEAGVKHDFDFDDIGFTLTTFADVGYISNFSQQFVATSPHSSGFQHYDVGVIGTLSLNQILKFAPRYGQFSLQPFITYTGRFSNPLLANTVLWGGIGIAFKY